MEYRREIDGLRAIAVLSVVFFHAGFGVFRGGFVGVDVFFVISGYLIAANIMSELEESKFSVASFYERRARRILPALHLVMFSCIPIAWLLLLPGDMRAFSESLVAASLFASNFLFWAESGYFETAGDFKPLLHTWSLAVEEQYYLLFPLLLMLLWRVGKGSQVAVMAALFVVSFVLAQWASVVDPGAAFYLLPSRVWELLVGVFAAYYLSRNRRVIISRGACEVGALLGMALISCAVFAYDEMMPFPGVYALAPTLGAMFVIVFATRQTLIGRFIGSRAFVGVGLVSYSAYLWHQPLFAFARHGLLGRVADVHYVYLTILAFVLAYLSWRFVEVPFRSAAFIGRRLFFWLAFTASSLFVGFGFSLGYGGFDLRSERVLQGDLGHSEFHRHIHDAYRECEPHSVARRALSWDGYLRCMQSGKGRPDVVLLGDSHAEHLFLGVADRRGGHNVAFYINDGKPFVDNKMFEVIFSELLGNGLAQHVVLAMHYMGRLDANGGDLYDGLDRTIMSLKLAGKSVSIVGDVPQFGYDPGYCVYPRLLRDFVSPCYLSAEDFDRQRAVYRSILIRLSNRHGVRYIDASAPLCSGAGCSSIENGAVLYRDNNHLNILGSKLVGRYVGDMLPL